ncbi:MAG TPA: hypothetical protein VGG05_14710 [Pseudonocardiaceae bacterium]|jgi:hypothetical protein
MTSDERQHVINTESVTGILDPEDPSRWLVCPWPARANFSEVVRHFLMACLERLQGGSSRARQLAYFEGYRAALSASRGDDPRRAVARDWRDALLECVDRCVMAMRTEQAS